ncbi:MAG: hypothetical protein IJM05_06865 [Bacteroidales bacterium]|nr:hypothetical protein [Bacteroidales bacterium]
MRDNLIGILVTVSVHLAVILVLLLTVVRPEIDRRRQSIMLDFSRQDPIEKLEKELARQKAANDRVERMLREAGVRTETPRNVAVDRSKLKDDRGTDAEKLYEDARRIERQARENINRKQEDFAAISQPKPKPQKPEKEEPAYQGPSVLSYSLGERKGSYLPIPAYKCIGAGEVTVIVTVNAAGDVVDAKVQDEVSSADRCLRDYALGAAKRSRFSRSKTGNPKEIGNIVYSFIAQ